MQASPIKHCSGRVSAPLVAIVLAIAMIALWLLINYELFDVPNSPPPHNITS